CWQWVDGSIDSQRLPHFGGCRLYGEKHPDTDEDANLRKRSKRATSKQPAGAIESTTKAPALKGKELAGKGKESTEVEEVPEWGGYSIRHLCEVEDKSGVNRYFASIMTWFSPGEGEELLMPRWTNTRIATLRTANEEITLGASQEVVATVKHQEKELKAIMDQLRAELGSSKNRRKNLEQEVDTLHSSL
ncbi:hypothetical protein BHE74_00048617, partial [Ensete ventricosum]